MDKLAPYFRLMRFHQPTGLWLLFFPVAWAMILANRGLPSLQYFLIFTAGVILMRSAGCVANDLADRKFDKHVARTKDRPVTTGEVSVCSAIALLIVLLACAASLLFFLNTLCFYLAILAACLTLFYPFCKRFMNFPQLVLGITFNMGVLMVYAQTQGNISREALMVYTAAAIWTIAFDTLYAMADKDDDVKVGIKSSARSWGEFDFDMVCMLYGALVINLLGMTWFLHVPIWAYCFWLAPIALIMKIIFDVYRARESALAAFKMNTWVGLLVLGVLGGMVFIF